MKMWFSKAWDRLGLVLAIVIITIVSLVPEGQIQPDIAKILFPVITNIGHVIAYAILVILLIRAASPWISITKRTLVGIVAAALLFGTVMEALQLLTGRTASFQDIVLDGLGVAIGAIIMRHRVRSASASSV